MRINVAVPEAHVDAPVLDAALESVTRLNQSLLASGQVPTFDRALLRGIQWKPEPPGAEHFDHAAVVNARGWGDCDDLAPYAASSYRHTGEDPGARAIVQRSGPKSWHAVVQMSDGSIRDPSKRAGMAPGIPHGVRGATLPMMYPTSDVAGTYIIRPQIALRPYVNGLYQARADFPWHWRDHLEQDKPTKTDIALTALHTAPVASTALTGAIDGALMLSEANGLEDTEHHARLSALADAIDGAPIEELSEVYGEEIAEAASQVVGSFFSHLNPIKAVKSAAHFVTHNPLTRGALSFVPGGGAALQAYDSLSRMMPGAHPAVAQRAAPAFPTMPGGGSSVPMKTRGTYRVVFE